MLDEIDSRWLPAEYTIQRKLATEAGVVVVFLGRAQRPSEVVLKLATTGAAERSLGREVAALNALVANGELGPWTSLLPSIRGQGWLTGSRFVVLDALLGREATALVRGDALSRQRVLEAAAAAIAPLHECAYAVNPLTSERVHGWLTRSEHLVQSAVWHAGGERARASLRRLAAVSADGLVGRQWPTGWIHGDYWPGNVLVEANGYRVTGILDWDFAGENELLALDLLHLLLYARRLGRRRDLGLVVRDFLAGETWTREELAVLRAGKCELLTDREAAEAVVPIYWLRHIASNLEQSASYAQRGAWVRRNIAPVLTLFDASRRIKGSTRARALPRPVGGG